MGKNSIFIHLKWNLPHNVCKSAEVQIFPEATVAWGMDTYLPQTVLLRN